MGWRKNGSGRATKQLSEKNSQQSRTVVAAEDALAGGAEDLHLQVA
jgi:hypothetical protein